MGSGRQSGLALAFWRLAWSCMEDVQTPVSHIHVLDFYATLFFSPKGSRVVVAGLAIDQEATSF